MNRSNMPKQVMTFSNGGLASFIPRQTQIAGQPHMLAYINPREEQILQDYRGNAPVVAGPAGVPSYLFGFDSISDMFDGGGKGGSGANFSTKSHEDYVRDNPLDTTARAHSTDNDDNQSSYEDAAYGGSQADFYNNNQNLPISNDVGFLNSIAMGLGFKEETPEYYAATADTIARTQGADAAARYISQMQDKGNISSDTALVLSNQTKDIEIDPMLADTMSSGDNGSAQTGDDQTDGEEGDGEDEEDGPPSSLNFRFFGGYNPISRSDVLVPSSFRQDITTPDARLDPMFPQRPEPVYDTHDPVISGGFNYGDGPEGSPLQLLSGQPQSFAEGVTPGPGMPGQGQFATMQELMEYQQKFPGVNLMGEYRRLKALEGGAAQPAALPQKGIASLMGGDPATEAMFQGIMS